MSAFNRIYRENFRFVWAAAHRCGVPADAVEDVVQDVFITAHRRLQELDWEISARGWLFGVTRNVAMRHRRGSARRGRREALHARGSARAVHPHRRHDAARTLDTLLACLSPPLREVFEMSEVLGMTAPEVAAELGVPANTVYSRLRLARRKVTAQAGSIESADRDVAAVRDANTPTARDQERTHAALLPLLQLPWWSLPTLLGSVTWPAVVLVVAATGYAVVANDHTDTPSPPAPVATELSARTPPLEPPHLIPFPVPPAARAKDPSGRVVPVAPSSASADTRRRKKPVPNSRTAASPVPAPDPLSAELVMLDRARAVLERGDAVASLKLLDEYAREFPDGQLSAVALSTRCRAERAVEPAGARMSQTGGGSKTRPQCPDGVMDPQRGGEL